MTASTNNLASGKKDFFQDQLLIAKFPYLQVKIYSLVRGDIINKVKSRLQEMLIISYSNHSADGRYKYSHAKDRTTIPSIATVQLISSALVKVVSSRNFAIAVISSCY